MWKKINTYDARQWRCRVFPGVSLVSNRTILLNYLRVDFVRHLVAEQHAVHLGVLRHESGVCDEPAHVASELLSGIVVDQTAEGKILQNKRKIENAHVTRERDDVLAEKNIQKNFREKFYLRRLRARL